MSLPTKAVALIEEGAQRPGPVVFLTGAGISAESGIPTFRGPEGYWKIGSVNYRPEELATRAAFARMPDEVWSWYLYRRGVCRAAAPNEAHRAIVSLEAELGDRMLLITQNVDGLHLRAGNSLERTYQIHGNIDFMRCWEECPGGIVRIPEEVGPDWPKERRIGDLEHAALQCAECGGTTRPHVLWFDESYDEERFRFRSALDAAQSCSMLVVVGTSGLTNLPLQVGSVVAERGAPLLVVNPEPNPFSRFAQGAETGVFLQGTAGQWVPLLTDAIAAAVDPARVPK